MVRKTLYVVGLLIIAIAAYLNVVYGFGPNLGLPFGYYGKFNVIVGEIENRGDASIVDSWQHTDMTIEEFWIDVLIDGKTTRLEFKNANVRSVEELKSELAKLN